MAVSIRMKQMGRKHRPFYRIVAIDKRRARDGRTIEELGTYDPMIRDTDSRAKFNPERVKYWLSVGAKPSESVAILIKKYMAKFEAEYAAKAVEAAAAKAAATQPAEPTTPPAVPTNPPAEPTAPSTPPTGE